MALLLKYLLLSVKPKALIGILLRVMVEMKQTAQTVYCRVEEQRGMSKGCVFSCDEEQEKRRKTKITYLMCLILVLSLFLCQSCDEEIKGRQKSESRIGVNKSSGTQSGSWGMFAMVRRGINM